uniref:NADH dehydrogenase subunit 6 n=1 Tax=Araniella displicata TaxID=336630 RepID=UPI00207A130F|nr:NADH dehydrogenase subunit 6 [Araniella displicata]URW97650.1 NADH dehydrogenase subunit 6 [Araniella displicata]
MKAVVTLGILFVLSTQPMMVISSLIFTVLMYSLFLYWNLMSYWFSYMMVLVLMSGVLVVFTYMMSILPNESFEISSLIFVIMGITILHNYKGWVLESQEISLGSMKLWGDLMLVGSLVLVSYLLFMMIMIVWVSIMEKGAIRIS